MSETVFPKLAFPKPFLLMSGLDATGKKGIIPLHSYSLVTYNQPYFGIVVPKESAGDSFLQNGNLCVNIMAQPLGTFAQETNVTIEDLGLTETVAQQTGGVAIRESLVSIEALPVSMIDVGDSSLYRCKMVAMHRYGRQQYAERLKQLGISITPLEKSYS